MTLPDLLILILACYLLTDYLVNRELPYNIMGRIRDRLQWGTLRCMYCASIWCAAVVYLVWLVEPQLIYPLTIAGGMLMMWRYTGGNHA